MSGVIVSDAKTIPPTLTSTWPRGIRVTGGERAIPTPLPMGTKPGVKRRGDDEHDYYRTKAS